MGHLEFQEEPDNETFSCRVYYKVGLGRDKLAMCFIKVPVYYYKTGPGEVATFYFLRSLARGELIWRRGKDLKK